MENFNGHLATKCQLLKDSTCEGTAPLKTPVTSQDQDESCPVCGDKVSGYHYGLLTCESCKGFFKRTVQNNKSYSCVENKKCPIDKTQRKRCPFCRFQKCLRVGMRLDAVRRDRMRGGRNKFGPMYKQDRARKQQMQAFNRAAGILNIIDAWNNSHSLGFEQSMVHPTPEAGRSRENTNSTSVSFAKNVYNGYEQSSLIHPPVVPVNAFDIKTSSGPPDNHASYIPNYNLPQNLLLESDAKEKESIVKHHQKPVVKTEPRTAKNDTGFHVASTNQQPHIIFGNTDQLENELLSRKAAISIPSYHLSKYLCHDYSFQSPEKPTMVDTVNHKSHELNDFFGNLTSRRFPNEPGFLFYSATPSGNAHFPPTMQLAGLKSTSYHPENHFEFSSTPTHNALPFDSHFTPIHADPTSKLIPKDAEPKIRNSGSDIVTTQADRSTRIPEMLQNLMKTHVEEKEAQQQILCSIRSAPHQGFNYICDVANQSLFVLVKWAKSLEFFQELKTNDQMTLLQNSWLDILVLDHVYRQVRYSSNNVVMVTGHAYPLAACDIYLQNTSANPSETNSVKTILQRSSDLVVKLKNLDLDHLEFVCLKFLILFNADASAECHDHLKMVQEKLNETLWEYTYNRNIADADRVGQLLYTLSEIRTLSIICKEYLVTQYHRGNVASNNLLIEMLHVK